jgi:hypothetical protein
MAGRTSPLGKANRYIALVNQEFTEGGNPQKLKDILKDWVGTAKVSLTMEQQAQVLYFIYTEVTPNDRIADYIIRHFGKEI